MVIALGNKERFQETDVVDKQADHSPRNSAPAAPPEKGLMGNHGHCLLVMPGNEKGEL